PVTMVSFVLPQAARVNLSVYDVAGHLVSKLVEGWREAGNHEITFDGSGLASGVYLCRLSAAKYTAAAKLVVVK
ncbi:MAG TPA: T9SS type A sorting domain-containing protein, partial [bacterium]